MSPTSTAKKTAKPPKSGDKKTNEKVTPRKTAKRVAPATNALTLLRDDHQLVSSLFAAFEKTESSDRKHELVQDICRELTIHAEIEEEIFYPAVQEALNDDELVPEAKVEHETLKNLIAQLKAMAPQEALYDARVKVLSEYVKHHVKEEQDEMFPKVKKTELDLEALGEELQARKKTLVAEYEPDGGQGVLSAISGTISRMLG